jgi:hypothetical protein
MIDIYHYYNYSTETISYYYRRLKNKANVFYYQYLYKPPQNNVFLNV